MTNDIRLKSIYVLLAALLISFTAKAQQPISDGASMLRKQGLVNVTELDSSIRVHLIYATADNFVGRNMYGDLKEAFLQPSAAKMLVKAQRELKRLHPELAIIVYDAARPQRIQRIMWGMVKGTPQQKYVASPQYVSMHTYGVAVDVSIVDGSGVELDMGTLVDYFGELAEPRHEARLLASGELTHEQITNRMLLRSAMKKAGFKSISIEWWHFEACSREQAKARYTPIE